MGHGVLILASIMHVCVWGSCQLPLAQIILSIERPAYLREQEGRLVNLHL